VQHFLTTRTALWLALPIGAALALAFAPFEWWPLGILCPAYLFLMWRDAAPKRAAQAGFLFTAGNYLAGTYWLYHSIYEIGHAPILLTLIAMIGLVAIMGGYTALLGYLLVRFVKPPRESNASSFWFVFIAMPCAYVLLEWFRGWFLSGFPWLELGYTPIDTPLAAYAPIGGVYFVSFIVAICAGGIAAAVVASKTQRIIALATVAVIWIAAALLWHKDWTRPAGSPITTAIVQGAVPQEMKWDQEQYEATLQLYRDLTKPYLGRQLIIWPESALAAPQEYLGGYLDQRWNEAREHGSDMLLGQLRHDLNRDVYWNAVLGLSDRPQWYAKRRLVPLAESFPVPKFIRDWLKGLDLPYSGFEPGAKIQPALELAGQKIGASICYEDAYASDQLPVLREATLLVNVTNDAWFGESTAAYQHLQISRMRALEAGRVLLRAANDGISAVIDSQGNVEKTLPRFKPAVLTATVQPRTGLTPYARVGNWFVILLCVALVIVTILARRRVGSDEARRSASVKARDGVME
jgi:apolipoprotein N-acyltransferase